MKAGVQQARKVRREACPEEAAFLELLRTTDQLSRGLVPLLKAERLSPTQYNVLRILRGTPEGLPCGEIGQRMITRDSGHHPAAGSIGEAGPHCEMARRQRPAHGPGPDYARRTEDAGPA